MSDMSFNQAMQLAERLEMTEITLNQTLKQINSSIVILEETLEKQSKIATYLPKANKQLSIMKVVVAINVGLIIGLIVAKYII